MTSTTIIDNLLQPQGCDDSDWQVTISKAIEAVKFREANKSKILYCYSKPNTMDGYLQNGDCHRYTDDVALCYADNIEQAIDIFSRLYDKSLLENNVREVEFNNYGIFIATDY